MTKPENSSQLEELENPKVNNNNNDNNEETMGAVLPSVPLADVDEGDVNLFETTKNVPTTSSTTTR